MSESKTPTPRTDNEEFTIEEFLGDGICRKREVVLSAFARTLELELNEAKRKLNAIELVRGTHDCGCEVCGMGSAVCPASASSYALAIVEAKDQLTTAQQDLEKIANALRTQQQRYHDLSEDVEGLRKDKERLDWLNNQPTDVEPDGDLLIWATPFTYPSAYSTGDETIRQAIDSAMKGPKE